MCVVMHGDVMVQHGYVSFFINRSSVFFSSFQAIHVNTSLVSSRAGAKTHVQAVGLFI